MVLAQQSGYTQTYITCSGYCYLYIFHSYDSFMDAKVIVFLLFSKYVLAIPPSEPNNGNYQDTTTNTVGYQAVKAKSDG